MGAPALGDPCQPLGTFPIITAPEGLLDRKTSTSNEDFPGSEVGIIKMPLLNTQRTFREKLRLLDILPETSPVAVHPPTSLVTKSRQFHGLAISSGLASCFLPQGNPCAKGQGGAPIC